MSENVCAIVLNWNCFEDTSRCVATLKAQEPALRVVVVDNGSGDDSVARLRGLAGVDLVLLPENLGYAGGMNAGIRLAREVGYQWVWLLNADTVPRSGALSAMLEQSRDAVAVGTCQVTSESPEHPDESPYVAAARIVRGRVREFTCAGCSVGRHEADVVTGASLLLDVECLRKVGDFDESFFHYKEEFDLVRRMAATGGSVVLACNARVWHQCGRSMSHKSPIAEYYWHRNEVLYIRKSHKSPLLHVLGQKTHYRLVLRSLAGLVLPHRRNRSLAALAGYRDGLRGVSGKAKHSWR
ncbi:glycosyltransferase family 2 protein [Cryptosporangium arvum]|uniref:glycosyltransferase family 2 protein n=1 Tax=Cryptosporangium arvum TaxID=80871 RepID=UPI00056951D6|nr:glycosyltransferase family 2 protein [Cryptosporangium arvum]